MCGLNLRAALVAIVAVASVLRPAPAGAAFEDVLREALAAVVRDARGADREALAKVREFYERRGYAPAWTKDGRLDARGAALVEAFARAAEDGLEPDAYTLAAPPGPTPGEAAATEIGLARSLLRYACDLRVGRVEPDPPEEAPYVARRPTPACAILDGAAAAPDLAAYLAGLAPPAAEYRRLKATLARYRALAAAGGWMKIAPGPTLKVGMRDARVAALRRALAARGDGTGETAGDPELFDFDLATAVRHFQARHGLATDGVFGKATQLALDVPVEARIGQIVRNLERRRWMPDDLGRRHVLVNLADFTLKFVDGPKTVFDTRVIVGTPYQKSPLFSAAITAIELNPYWNVPDKIARTELLPLIRDDPYYLADNNLRVLATQRGRTVAVDPETVDWSALRPDAFPFRLRQEPGLENALGRIKFLMPNRWDVYLHDTPSRELFERAVRSFSHGCIRVENPFELAGRLFAPEGAWTPERLAEAAANGERRTIRLAAPVPVHIVYLTAWTNRDGSVHFRDDIYGRDQRLGVALARTAAR